MSILRIEYDMARSGFLFMVGGFDKRQPLPSKWAAADIYTGQSGRFAALESERRLPLRKLHYSEFDDASLPVLWQRSTPVNHSTRLHLRQKLTPWEEFILTRPEGDFVVDGDSFRVNAFHLRQTKEDLSVWFSEGDDVPRANWIQEEEPDYGITLWFTSRTAPHTRQQIENGLPPCRLLAGMRIKLASSEAQYPVTRLILTPMDFK